MNKVDKLIGLCEELNEAGERIKIASFKGKFWYVNPANPNELISLSNLSNGINSNGKHRVLTGKEDEKQRAAIKAIIKGGGSFKPYKNFMQEAGKPTEKAKTMDEASAPDEFVIRDGTSMGAVALEMERDGKRTSRPVLGITHLMMKDGWFRRETGPAKGHGLAITSFKLGPKWTKWAREMTPQLHDVYRVNLKYDANANDWDKAGVEQKIESWNGWLWVQKNVDVNKLVKFINGQIKSGAYQP